MTRDDQLAAVAVVEAVERRDADDLDALLAPYAEKPEPLVIALAELAACALTWYECERSDSDREMDPRDITALAMIKEVRSEVLDAVLTDPSE